MSALCPSEPDENNKLIHLNLFNVFKFITEFGRYLLSFSEISIFTGFVSVLYTKKNDTLGWFDLPKADICLNWGKRAPIH